MCECRDCDNFKAKKRDPQIGDEVECECGYGVIISHKGSHNFSTGEYYPDAFLIHLNGGYDTTYADMDDIIVME